MITNSAATAFCILINQMGYSAQSGLNPRPDIKGLFSRCKASRIHQAGLLICVLFANSGFAANDIRIAFGSCLKQDKPAPVLQTIVKEQPNAFIFMGDNVYADTTDMRVMRDRYSLLTSRKEFKQLKLQGQVMATWDDHDYGRNDAGREYSARHESSRVFLEAFDVARASPRWQRPGVYGVEYVGTGEQRIQVIMLDTRFFRTSLRRGFINLRCLRKNLKPDYSPDATILGKVQWHWLEQQLLEPAKLRIIVSSIQVIPNEHCLEKWANFPLERERLFKVIKQTQAKGVLLVSGDRHMAEISLLDTAEVRYPLYEITSSSLNASGAGKGETNSYRITEDNYREDNFGVISVDWNKKDPLITLQIRNVNNRAVVSRQVGLSELQ